MNCIMKFFLGCGFWWFFGVWIKSTRFLCSFWAAWHIAFRGWLRPWRPGLDGCEDVFEDVVWNVWNVLTCFIVLWGILRRFGVERSQNGVVIPVKIQPSCVERHVALLRHSKGWVDSEWQKLRYRAKSLRWSILFVASRDMISIHEHVFESFLDHVTCDTEN